MAGMKRKWRRGSRLLPGLILLVSMTSLSLAEEPEIPLNYFNGLSGDEWVKANQGEVEKHYAVWQSAQGKERARARDVVLFYAWRGAKPDMPWSRFHTTIS